jgi:trehalose 6-phosphate phosphatase
VRFRDIQELTQWARGSPRLWLFLDYDGTLVDFAPTPDHIEPDLAIIRLLERLARRPATRVTVLSGRRLEHLRQLLPATGVFLAGTYGIELRTPRGDTIHRIDYESVRPVLDAIKPQWTHMINGRKGFFLEDKGWTLALHARFADHEEARQVLAQARQAAAPDSLAGRFRILGGHKFLEVAPLLASKRETVSHLLEQYPFAEMRLLYIGDDDKDEEAFSVIHAHRGVAAKVAQPSQASSPTEADIFFESPKDAVRWLEQLA